MRLWIHKLASLKITVVLLVLILLVLSVGTIVESRLGTEAARAVYYAGWFYLLLGMFSLNLLAALIDKLPWKAQRIGFALTHISMVVILAGALISQTMATQGKLALWEGEESNSFMVFSDDGKQTERPLPFTIRLDAFEIDVYPGTMRPAMFRSKVFVTDPQWGNFTSSIEMNREMSHGGYTFYQSSYQREEGRDMTVLSVAKDPGMPIVFVGYFMLVGGMITVLSTRIYQRRALAKLRAGQGAPRRTDARKAPIAAVILLPLLLGLLSSGGAGAQLAEPRTAAAQLPDPRTIETARALPVQYDGRVMPLDTMARDAVRQITGKSVWNGTDPVALVLGWSFSADSWKTVPLVKSGGAALEQVTGLTAGASHVAYQDMVMNVPFMRLLRQVHQKLETDQKLNPLEKEASGLEDRLITLRNVMNGSFLRVLPTTDPVAAWGVPEATILGDFMVAALGARSTAPAYYPSAEAMNREILYNRVHPTRLAWWILVPATLLSILAWRKPGRIVSGLTVLGLVAGFAVMTWGILVRWQIADRIPASNMYESMLFLAWGVGLFALIAAGILKNWLVILNATAMSALTLLLVDTLPIDPFIHPMPPVLSGTPWLAIHVPIIMVSYSVLALGVLIAHMQIGLTIAGKGNSLQARNMNDLLYWYMQVGSILLIAGILTGSIWASSSWGRYWGWDPKEVWSLIAFLAYMAILHGRFDHIIGPFGVAVASIAAFWMILMTYVGVNYVLASGLHSYGFGGSGVVQGMGLVLLVEALFLGAGWMAVRKKTIARRVA